MEDQERLVRFRDTSSIAFSAAAVKTNPTVWKRLESGEYVLIFASLRIFVWRNLIFGNILVKEKQMSFPNA